MHHVADERFITEAHEWELRANCEQCVYFEPGSGTCSEQYPNQVHRMRLVVPGDVVTFCKKFELW